MSWPFRDSRPWVYGHRGVRDIAPENTLLAFDVALAKGADGIEFDVQVTRDGTAVVFHDASLERMTGGREKRLVAELTAEEACLTALEKGATIPAFCDVLRWAEGNRLFLNIELKCTESDSCRLVDAVERDIRAHSSSNLQRRLLISSFSVDAIRHVIARNWPFHIAQLADEGQPGSIRNMSGARGIHSHFSQVEDADDLPTRREHFVNVWTVNEPSVARRMNQLGVDGIITDEIGRIFDAMV